MKHLINFLDACKYVFISRNQAKQQQRDELQGRIKSTAYAGHVYEYPFPVTPQEAKTFFKPNTTKSNGKN